MEQVGRFVTSRVQPWESVLDGGGPAASSALAGLRREAKEAGLWALPLPRSCGGQGWGLGEYFAVAEAEGASDHGPAALGSASLLDVRMLSAFGTGAVRERWVRALVSGEARGSYAMTEPGVAGSDPGAVRLRATRVAGGWVLSGRKWFVSGVREAAFTTVLAAGASLFVVPTDAPGFRVVRDLPVLGALGQVEVELDEVRVGEEALLGEVGQGLVIAGTRLALGRTLRCLRWVGQAERAYRLLCARAVSREVGGVPLGDRQLVRQHVFESALAVRSARALVHEAAALVAAGEDARIEIGLAKVAAARTLTRVVDSATQVYGAEGLTPTTPLPMLTRLARTARILDGADELHIDTTARRLLR
ncbi:acyl-CoA dehydrogenase family protein [Actinosynnema sp. NPDC020468]|uniref:acyl-CoA dehydrogenase family protein n=1 Tax=Actinosynnema sp. NPDC020468 TaxID=3154488 RepID=UPI0033DFC132